jgi:serine/threonine-protein kinase RsbT
VNAAEAEPIRIAIERDGDVVNARQTGRALATDIGFRGTDLTLIATAISEVARNIVVYAVRGEIRVSAARDGFRRGIAVVAHDDGPGIPDLELAMRDGYSTGKSLGLGLSGARRLMDEFEIVSEVGVGTTITMRKWTR